MEPLQIVVVVIYLLAIGYLGFLGYQRTKTAADYLLAGRQIHPFVMALSYGATFISTSAIVGFGGVAGLFGMSLLWLTFLNIFVGIFVAFVFLGGPTRRMGHHLDAHTFPELIGRRYGSKFIQVFAGLVIFLFIPLYAAAVLIAGCEFIANAFHTTYGTALLVFSIIIAAYVVVGGLKGVMYTDALQGSVMFIGMFILLLVTYSKLGGVTEAHRALTDMADLVPGKLAAIGHQGWTSMPPFGFGDLKYNLWWIVVSNITLGVGIGVLAQPQLAVRFMTVRSKKQLNRAVLVGGLFILMMTGTAFTVGALSNAYFIKYGPEIDGRVIQTIDAEKNHAMIQVVAKNEAGQYVDVEGKMAPVVLSALPEDGAVLVGEGDNASPLVKGRSISAVYAKGDAEQIIPTYLGKTGPMPKWFALLFLLTLLAAAMSTLSSQFHAVGTSIGRDVYEQLTPARKEDDSGRTIVVTRVGITIGIVLAVLISYFAHGQAYVVARFTAIFFGLCGSAFLPAFVGGLFFKRMTKAAAIWSMIVGFIVTSFWLIFIHAKEAGALGICNLIFGKKSLLEGIHNWPEVDPIVVALPLSIITAVVVAFLTKPPADEHLAKCFGSGQKKG